MAALKGADILAINDRQQESVVIPEWNDAEVFIRTMGAVERAKYEAKLMSLKDAGLDERMWTIKLTLVVLCACDESGNRLFTDDQFEAVADKSADAIDRLFDVINRLNLVTQDQVEAEQGN